MATPCCHAHTQSRTQSHDEALRSLLAANRRWAADMRAKDPEFFDRLVNQQNPEYLWIGCSDSRVPANEILAMPPGAIFVQRNVGNQAMHTDMNLMACLEYAVKSLKVKHIILCGHYNCGAVKAALQLPHCTPGLVNCWISDIRECRNQHEQELRGLDPEQQLARLCELNVLRQVFHVATSPVVASAWAEGQELHLCGLIYDLSDGHLRKLAGPISSDEGYERSLDGFVMGGRQVTRCPTTHMLCMSSATDEQPGLAAAASPSNAAIRSTITSSAGGGGAAAASDDDDDDPADGFGAPPVLLSTPSELIQNINNINLADRIFSHKRWTSIGSASASPSGGCSPVKMLSPCASSAGQRPGPAAAHAHC